MCGIDDGRRSPYVQFKRVRIELQPICKLREREYEMGMISQGSLTFCAGVKTGHVGGNLPVFINRSPVVHEKLQSYDK